MFDYQLSSVLEGVANIIPQLRCGCQERGRTDGNGGETLCSLNRCALDGRKVGSIKRVQRFVLQAQENKQRHQQTASCTGKGTHRQRDKETKRQRNKETNKQLQG